MGPGSWRRAGYTRLLEMAAAVSSDGNLVLDGVDLDIPRAPLPGANAEDCNVPQLRRWCEWFPKRVWSGENMYIPN